MASEKGECIRMPAQKMPQAPQLDKEVCQTLADGNSKIQRRVLSGILSLPALLSLFLVAGCSTTDTVTPTVRAQAGYLSRIVFWFTILKSRMPILS